MGRRATGSTMYFAEREEQAVLDYINSDNIDEKNKIYNEILREPFRKMTESILRKYPVHIGNYDMAEIEANALAHLIDQMVNFNPNNLNKAGKKTKAFSYCQTIVRNFYIDHGKRSYKEKTINLNFDDHLEDIYEKDDYQYEIGNDNIEVMNDLINNIINKIKVTLDTDKTLKKNEIIVGDAILNILINWNVLFLEDSPEGRYNKRVTNKFAKNKILLFLKEQTDLSTKEIRLASKPFKELYFIEKSIFFD